MKVWKKSLAALLAVMMLLSMAACGQKEEEEPEATIGQGTTQPVEEETPEEVPAEDPVTVRAAALKGPTAMGLVQLMDRFGVAPTVQEEPVALGDLKAGENGYSFILAAAADEVTPLLIKGDLDVACVPANLASVLYNKTEGQIVTLGINTLGVLYIVENGDSVQSLEDLKGQTIVASGKGSTPEYGLRYLLAQNGIDPDKDVTIEWKSEHSECVAALASGAAAIALLPQPFVTVAQGKIESLRIALDLTAEWDALENGSAMITGVVVARKAFVEEHPAAVDKFLQDYAESVEWVNANHADAAALIGGYGIVDAAVAEKALPYCNIVCITRSEMKDKLSGYLNALAEQAPESVGGKVPAADFYYVG